MSYKKHFLFSSKGGQPYDFWQLPDWLTVLIYDIPFTVSEPNYYLKDIYYFWHMSKQSMFKL